MNAALTKTMQTLDQLQAFAIDDRLTFRSGPGGLLHADIVAADGRASLSLQGAQLTHFQPAAQSAPLLWLSPRARHAAQRPIRGGVPVCWPWFGAHASDTSLPLHGYARVAPWELIDSACVDGRVQLTLRMRADEATRLVWPHETPLELYVEVGDAVSIELTTINAAEVPVKLGEALHAYFTVGDVEQVEVLGLAGARYLDKTLGFAEARQNGALRIAGETDRVYLDTEARCSIVDPLLGRRIVIDKSGSSSTVVWSPGEQRGAEMADIGSAHWRGMLCVESANAAANALTLQPGELHTLAVRYAAESL